jgi:hypothetical protein
MWIYITAGKRPTRGYPRLPDYDILLDSADHELSDNADDIRSAEYSINSISSSLKG